MNKGYLQLKVYEEVADDDILLCLSARMSANAAVSRACEVEEQVWALPQFGAEGRVMIRGKQHGVVFES